MYNKDVRNGPNSELLHDFSLLVALRAEEGIILAKALFACVETEIELISIVFII